MKTAKKVIAILVLLAMVLPFVIGVVNAESTGKLIVNGTELETKVVYINGVAYATSSENYRIYTAFTSYEDDVMFMKKDTNNYRIPLNSNVAFKNSTTVGFSNHVIKVDNIVYVPIEATARLMGYFVSVEGNTIRLTNSLGVIGIVQDNSFIEMTLNKSHKDRVDKLLKDYSIKTRMRIEEVDYVDYRAVEEFYAYKSSLPSEKELDEGKYSFGNYLNPSIGKYFIDKASKSKTILGLTETEVKFEPVAFYRTKFNVNIIVGYENYVEQYLDVAYKTYVDNMEKISWQLMTQKSKDLSKKEIIKLFDEMRQKNIRIFIVQDGRINYFE